MLVSWEYFAGLMYGPHLCEASDPKKPLHRARSLISIDSA